MSCVGRSQLKLLRGLKASMGAEEFTRGSWEGRKSENGDRGIMAKEWNCMLCETGEEAVVNSD